MPESNKFYKVCIRHKDRRIKQGNEINVFSYNDEGKASLTQKLGRYLTLADYEPNPKYFLDKKVQETNPNPKSYSCLGSLEKDPGLFGDCDYNPEKRIWLRYDEDTEAPKSKLRIPYMAHQIKLKIDRTDDLSGVKTTKYCVTTPGKTCDPNTEYDDKKGIVVTCQNDWSCVKTIIYYSIDNADNKEAPKTKDVQIVSVGSNCQSDCTAKPDPGRYQEACNNLNGCQYLEINNDEGEAVAKACNGALEHTEVPLNTTHKVKCPYGPITKKTT